VGYAVSAGVLGAVRVGSHLEQLEALHVAVGEAVEAERERVRRGEPTRVLRPLKRRKPLPAPAVIRAWAHENGHMDPSRTRGPIPSEVEDAYRLEVLEPLEVLSCES